MRRQLVAAGIAAAGLLMGAAPAQASTTITIDGHFKESYPLGQPPPVCFTGSPCGIGRLKGYGTAAETFSFGGVDGRDANGCALIHGTDVIELDDSQHSQFQEIEHDTICTPGGSHQAPGHFDSYGKPESVTGTWTVIPGSATGVFAGACAGSGQVSGGFAGGTGNIDYEGNLQPC